MGNYVSNTNKLKEKKELEVLKKQIIEESNRELLFGGLIFIATLAAVSLGVLLVIGF